MFLNWLFAPAMAWGELTASPAAAPRGLPRQHLASQRSPDEVFTNAPLSSPPHSARCPTHWLPRNWYGKLHREIRAASGNIA